MLGANTRVWHFAHIRAGAIIGADCRIGNNVFIDSGVVIGDKVKLQNRVSLYRGVTLEDGVFVGPHVTFTNDKYPRAITPAGEIIDEDDWTAIETLVRYGASIGAGAVVLPGVTIGRWAMVGASALVSHDVPEQGLVLGNPAQLVGYVCRCGRLLEPHAGRWDCHECHESYDLPSLYEAGET